MNCLIAQFKTKLIIIAGFLFVSLALPSFVFSADYSSQLENLINQERSKAGLSPFSVNSLLRQTASNHNKLMNNCTNQYGLDACFKHQVTLLGEPTLMERIKQSGYNPTYVAENIAWGQLTAQATLNSWLSSSGHKAHILSTSAQNLGCNHLDAQNGNYKGMFWTCNFGKSSNPQVSPTQTPAVTPTSKPTAKPTVTPSPNTSATVKPTITPTFLPQPTQPPVSTRPWWCSFVPTHFMCK